MRLALAQILIEGGRPDANLTRAEIQIRKAASSGADLVLLPECVDLGWTDSSAATLAGAIPGGKAYERLRVAARQCHLYVCAGLVESHPDGPFNSAVLIDPDGRLLRLHRKINELGIAHPLYAAGQSVEVVATRLGMIGVMICADAFASGLVISHSLGLMGAQLILSPCAWAVPPTHQNDLTPYGGLWTRSYAPVATSHGLWIAACSGVGALRDGPWAGWRQIGNSMVVDPAGATVAMGPHGAAAEAQVLVDLTLPRRRRPESGP